MHGILEEIINYKKIEVQKLHSARLGSIKRTDAKRPFIAALDRRPKLSLIAEVKKASPSKGLIAPDFDHVKIGKAYDASGASAISVLTDEKFFQGAPSYLVDVREAVSIPVLRKDFIIDPLQVQQTAGLNADAMLLIAAVLGKDQFAELMNAADELDIEVLIEIHTRAELDFVFTNASPKLVGINNRSLETFKTDLAVTYDLLPHIPAGVAVVSESGIDTGEQTKKLCDAGIAAILVGESLMRSKDVSALVKDLTHADKN